MASKTAAKHVNPDDTAKAIAYAVAQGDIVNFRTLFLPFSPARASSTESFDDEKYGYLLPEPAEEGEKAFSEALAAVRAPLTWAHIQSELEQRRPAQLPSDLLILLADNALRLGKPTAASQAYELVRVRRRMQEEAFAAADAKLDAGDVAAAVRGYRIAAGLSYDYSAFPEPLPGIPRYQTRALMLHGVYPRRPEDSIGLQPLETFLPMALSFLLGDAEAAGRLEGRDRETLTAFLQELIAQIDPEWDAFVARYREACDLAREFGERLNKVITERGARQLSLQEEIDAQMGEDPASISVRLLGRAIEGGEWWQYTKELAAAHPASILFIARQIVGEREIVVPRLRGDSPVVQRLGLLPAAAAAS